MTRLPPLLPDGHRLVNKEGQHALAKRQQLKAQRRVWESLAHIDPLWAILTSNDKAGRRWDEAEFFQTGHAEIESFVLELQGLGIKPPHGSVLDFGCGTGRLTQALAARFRDVVGVDISSQMIALARSYNQFHDRCVYSVNDTPDLRQFAAERFDLVYSNIVLQHNTPAHAASYIREFYRVVRSGGLVAFQMPSFICWRRRIQWRRRLFVLLQTLHLPSDRLVEKFGLNPMRMSFLPRKAVERLVRSCGGTILAASEWSDGEIASVRYITQKLAA